MLYQLLYVLVKQSPHSNFYTLLDERTKAVITFLIIFLQAFCILLDELITHDTLVSEIQILSTLNNLRLTLAYTCNER